MFREGFTPFEDGSGSGRPEAGDSAIPHCIGSPGHERRFRTDDDKVDVQLNGKVTDGFGARHVHRRGISQLSNTRIAWSDDDAVHGWISAQTLNDCMFPGSGSDDENAHHQLA